MTEPIRVPPQLPSDVPCPIAWVAEAPSDEEEEKLKPLVGPSGRVYNGMLRAAGLERTDFLITNLFDTKAPDNDVTPWLKDPAILGPAIERLRAEIEAAQPTVIVPLGAPALSVFADGSISGMRGTVCAAERVFPGHKMVPTFHPAHVMRQWLWLPIVVEDFRRAAREAALGPEIIWPTRRLILAPSLAQLREIVETKLLTADLIGVDIETGWGQITCIGFAWDEENAICVPFVDARKTTRSYWGSAEKELAAWAEVQRVLESPVPKIGQNFAAYDAYWLLEKYGIRTMNLRHDTRLLHHALYPELPKSLEFMGAAYTNQGPWKTWSKRGDRKRDD